MTVTVTAPGTTPNTTGANLNVTTHVPAGANTTGVNGTESHVVESNVNGPDGVPTDTDNGPRSNS